MLPFSLTCAYSVPARYYPIFSDRICLASQSPLMHGHYCGCEHGRVWQNRCTCLKAKRPIDSLHLVIRSDNIQTH
jgi:hypothetical protein